MTIKQEVLDQFPDKIERQLLEGLNISFDNWAVTLWSVKSKKRISWTVTKLDPYSVALSFVHPITKTNIYLTTTNKVPHSISNLVNLEKFVENIRKVDSGGNMTYLFEDYYEQRNA